MATLKSYASIARAPFLLLPVTLVLCGAGAAAFDGFASWSRSLIALVALVTLQRWLTKGRSSPEEGARG